MELLTKRNLDLRKIKERRKAIGKWFIISTLICYITIIHDFNIHIFQTGLNVEQCIFLLFIVMTDITSFLCLFDINKQIKHIQGYI